MIDFLVYKNLFILHNYEFTMNVDKYAALQLGKGVAMSST